MTEPNYVQVRLNNKLTPFLFTCQEDAEEAVNCLNATLYGDKRKPVVEFVNPTVVPHADIDNFIETMWKVRDSQSKTRYWNSKESKYKLAPIPTWSLPLMVDTGWMRCITPEGYERDKDYYDNLLKTVYEYSTDSYGIIVRMLELGVHVNLDEKGRYNGMPPMRLVQSSERPTEQDKGMCGILLKGEWVPCTYGSHADTLNHIKYDLKIPVYDTDPIVMFSHGQSRMSPHYTMSSVAVENPEKLTKFMQHWLQACKNNYSEIQKEQLTIHLPEIFESSVDL